MSGTTAEVQTDFASIVGESRAIADPEVCAGFAVDGVTPHSVVYAASAEEVAEVLRCSAAHDLAVIPCRNRSKLDIGAPPRRYDVALSLKDMNRVWYYEPDDLVVGVEPGMKFGDLQHFLARRQLWIPLDPGSGERASVGGILAANAAGPLRLRYGGPRDMVLGMKIATVDGRIVKTGGRVVKNVAGYDLAKLLIGSYSTLGVIVEATLKLFPQVTDRLTWGIDPGSLATAREIRRELLRSPLAPMRMVLLNRIAQRLIGCASARTGTGASPGASWMIWMEAGGSERVIARYAHELDALAAKHAASIRAVESEVAEEVWQGIADFGLGRSLTQPASMVAKATLPIASAEEFLEIAGTEAEAAGFEAAGLAQLGVGVVELGLFVNGSRAAIEGDQLQGPNPEPRNASPESQVPSVALIECLRRTAVSLGGSLVVTRCPAEFKANIDVWGPPGDDFEVMRKLKAAWDPKSTLSPGRFVGGL